MADCGGKEQQQEIEADVAAPQDAGSKQQQQQKGGGFRLWKKGGPAGKEAKRERPRDAVKLGCGGLFRRGKKSQKEQEAAAAAEPFEKPRDNGRSASKGATVKEQAEDSGQPAPTEEPKQKVAAAKVAPSESSADAPPPSVDTLPGALGPATDGEVKVEEASKDEAAATERSRVPPPRPANPPGATTPMAPVTELASEAGQTEEKAEKKAEEKLEQNAAEEDTAETKSEKVEEEEEVEKKAEEKVEEDKKATEDDVAETKSEDKVEEEEKVEKISEEKVNEDEKSAEEEIAEMKSEDKVEEGEKVEKISEEKVDNDLEEKSEKGEEEEEEEEVSEKLEDKAAEEENSETSEKATAEENGDQEGKEEAEEKATGQSQSAEDDEEETELERQRLAEERFKQASVDMSSVSAKAGVKIEQGPHTEMWSSIVNKSFVGTGVFKKAAVCSLATGGVMACSPADFTPTVEQAAALRDNFDSRGVFSGAGFGVADTVYQLQEETATEEILSGADADHTQAVLAFRTNTALVVAVCTERLDRAMQMLADMREHFISQGM